MAEYVDPEGRPTMTDGPRFNGYPKNPELALRQLEEELKHYRDIRETLCNTPEFKKAIWTVTND